MAKPRRDLSKIFRKILGNDHCYFSPPVSKNMEYPCIKYELDRIDSKFADNLPYATAKKYTVTVIDPNPDSEIPEKMLTISYCRFDRTYIVDGLNHFIFTIFY